jgi:hypothetical protein
MDAFKFVISYYHSLSPTHAKSHSKIWSQGQRLCKGIFQHPAAKVAFGLSGIAWFIYLSVDLN